MKSVAISAPELSPGHNLDFLLKHSNKRPLKACMLAYTFYESDGRVMRYAEALAQKGFDVEAIVLRRDLQSVEEVMNGVRVLRIQTRQKNERGKYNYLSRVLKFFFRSMIEITRRHMRDPYDIIHVHSVPDFEVFAAFIPKLKGARIILDIHDIVPEFYSAKFKVSPKAPVFKALKVVEKLSASFADHVVVSNHIWHGRLLDRSIAEDKCTVILNYPDSSIFYRRSNHSDHGKVIMIYPGTLNWHQGLDIAIKAFDKIKEKVPEAEFHIYGDGPSKPALVNLVEDLGLEMRVLLNGTRPLDKMAEIMSKADLGVVPKRNDTFGGEAFSTKILEFMSLGVPLIVSRTKIDSYYFNDSVVKFFKPEDETDLAEKMVALIKDRQERERLVANASRFVEDYTWENKQHLYLDLVNRLVHGKSSEKNREESNHDSTVNPGTRCD
jgi:glycosyltransferase involved in cell wall biosynthesis